MRLITNEITARVVEMNPSLAEDILSLNVKNRKIAKLNLSSTIHKMKTGKWQENGESIIIGADGVLKDGQHRLEATISSGHHWTAIIVTGVSSGVMSSIDTGRNRTASDVLTLNGYTYGALKASTSKLILQGRYTKDSAKLTNACNQTILEYVSSNNKKLDQLISIVNPTYVKQVDKIFPATLLCFIANEVSKGDFGEVKIKQIECFLKMLCGVVVNEGSAACWVRDRILRSKKKGNTLHMKWIYNAIIKSWNIYLDGDFPVKSIRVSIGKIEQPN